MKRVASPHSSLERAGIPLGKGEIVAIRQQDGEGVVHHELEPPIGLRRSLRIQAPHTNFAGRQRRKLDPGPKAASELLEIQLMDERCDPAAGRFRKLVSK